MTNNYCFEKELKKGEFYILRDENQEVLAFSKITSADWEIKRLPGKMGGVFIKMIPFIPGLNKIIRPKRHSFIVPEAVFVKENNPELLTHFFEGILAEESKNLMLWWVDPKDKLYKSVIQKVKWGLLNKIVGVSPVNVISKSINQDFIDSNQPFYSSGVDSV